MMSIFQIILILLAQYKSDASIWKHKLEIEQSTTDESVVLGEIVTKFLIKYFSEETIFISVVLGPPKRCGFHFQDDFFNELFDNPTLAAFPHDVLDGIDQTALDKRNAFNLLVVEDSKSLA